MGLFIRDDPHYNENERQRGFDRYKQLLSIRFGPWFHAALSHNVLTCHTPSPCL